jgi:signal transduction histidine kinase
LRPGVVLAEVLAVATTVVLDGAAWAEGALFGTRQSLSGSWPLVATLVAAVALGPRAGFVGAALGATRALAAVANGVDWDGGRVGSIVASTVFGAIAGVVGGWVADRLRTAEHEVAVTRAREEVTRSLHDSVLQTLAVVARTGEPEVADLARRTDRELRTALFGPLSHDASFRAAVERAARTAANRYELDVSISVIGEEPPARVGLAVAGAIGEAVNNVGKHAGATMARVFAEVDDDGAVHATVRDDGGGFDVALAVQGQGISQSIVGRIADVGGQASVDSTLGGGCVVTIEVPGR